MEGHIFKGEIHTTTSKPRLYEFTTTIYYIFFRCLRTVLDTFLYDDDQIFIFLKKNDLGCGTEYRFFLIPS